MTPRNRFKASLALPWYRRVNWPTLFIDLFLFASGWVAVYCIVSLWFLF